MKLWFRDSAYGSYITFVAYVSHRALAKASIHIDGQTAVLLDIQVYRTARISELLHWLTFWTSSSRNLRGRGIGSALLMHVCSDLKNRRISVLKGQIKMKDRRLPAWYSKFGFE